jgi:hypothetical protein
MYLGTTATNQNCIHEEIKSILKSGNVCYHSVQSFCSHLLSRNLQIKIYKLYFLHVVYCECETLSLTLREQHRLRVFENRVPRRIFGSKKEEVARGWRRQHNEELLKLYTSLNIIRELKSRRMTWKGHRTHMG